MPPFLSQIFGLVASELTVKHLAGTGELQVAFLFSELPQEILETGFAFIIAVREKSDAVVCGLLGDAVSRMQRSLFREIEPPVVLASRKGTVWSETVLGRVTYRQQRNQFGIDMDDLRRHLLAIGKTGCGKSTFLFNLVRQQMEAGRGVLIDPNLAMVISSMKKGISHFYKTDCLGSQHASGPL